MKKTPLLLLGILALVLWKSSSIGDVPVRTDLAIQNLGLHIALLRFEPKDKANLIQPLKKILAGVIHKDELHEKGLTHVIEALSAYGQVDVLHRSDRDVIISADSKVKFDSLEERPIVMLGTKDGMPPTPKFGLSLDVSAKPIDVDKFALSWNGSLRWSPELIDRWKFNPQQFLSFASNAAKLASDLTKKEEQNPLDIGLSVAQLFKASDKAPGQVFELPVVKEIAFQSSRVCHNEELIVNSTVSEVGGRPAQAVVLLIWPTINP